jgi:hypothetical protein
MPASFHNVVAKTSASIMKPTTQAFAVLVTLLNLREYRYDILGYSQLEMTDYRSEKAATFDVPVDGETSNGNGDLLHIRPVALFAHPFLPTLISTFKSFGPTTNKYLSLFFIPFSNSFECGRRRLIWDQSRRQGFCERTTRFKLDPAAPTHASLARIRALSCGKSTYIVSRHVPGAIGQRRVTGSSHGNCLASLILSFSS